jgi:predicted nucleic acid-binding protein
MGAQGSPRRGLTLDAGALIAYERYDDRVVTVLERAQSQGRCVTVPAGALGQVWRDGARQARLARLVSADGVAVRPLDEDEAKAAGRLCGRAGTSDLIDASVVIAAQASGSIVLTSDPGDLRRLDAALPLERV